MRYVLPLRSGESAVRYDVLSHRHRTCECSFSLKINKLLAMEKDDLTGGILKPMFELAKHVLKKNCERHTWLDRLLEAAGALWSRP